jgi:hypothetical protein
MLRCLGGTTSEWINPCLFLCLTGVKIIREKIIVTLADGVKQAEGEFWVKLLPQRMLPNTHGS